jgi:hypothetical protein
MARAATSRHLTAKSRDRTLVIPRGICDVKVALGQSFLRLLSFYLSTIFYSCCQYSHITWGMNNTAVCDRSSET